MNKIDILKQKIEGGSDFSAAIEKVKEQAAALSKANSELQSEFERGIYREIYDIMAANPYDSFLPSGECKIFFLLTKSECCKRSGSSE